MEDDCSISSGSSYLFDKMDAFSDILFFERSFMMSNTYQRRKHIQQKVNDNANSSKPIQTDNFDREDKGGETPDCFCHLFLNI